LAKQGRPELSFPVPKLQRGLTIASGSTVADLNNVIRRAKKALVQKVEGLARSTDKIVVIVAPDETHPVMLRGKWQHGLLVPVASPTYCLRSHSCHQLNGPVVHASALSGVLLPRKLR